MGSEDLSISEINLFCITFIYFHDFFVIVFKALKHIFGRMFHGSLVYTVKIIF